jgi:multidrug resistance efflux pump
LIGVASLIASRSRSEKVRAALSDVIDLLHHNAEVHRALQMPTCSTTVDASAYTLRVEGYFEETKLSSIYVGDAASIHVIGDEALLTGTIESIAGGIEDRERSAGSNLLANVNPTFSWVRLAQRVPVRIKLDAVPNGTRLIIGRSATVFVEDSEDRPRTILSRHWRTRPADGRG